MLLLLLRLLLLKREPRQVARNACTAIYAASMICCAHVINMLLPQVSNGLRRQCRIKAWRN